MVFTTPIPSGIKVHAEAYINWLAGDVSWGFDAEGDRSICQSDIE